MVDKFIEKVLNKASSLPFVDTPLLKAFENYNNAFDKESTYTDEEKIQACQDVIIAQHKELSHLRREAVNEVVFVKNEKNEIIHVIGCASAYYLSREIVEASDIFSSVGHMIEQDGLRELPFVELNVVEENIGG